MSISLIGKFWKDRRAVKDPLELDKTGLLIISDSGDLQIIPSFFNVF
jgi:hypothetical protein